MKIKYTTPKETEKVIKLLKSKSSHGYDRIPTKILKVSTPFITFPLTYICNKSLSLGIFPSRLKFSEMKPLHKKGDRMDIRILDLSLYLHPFQRFWKKLYIQDYINTLTEIIY
jgi:hypothetical protein